VNILIVDDDPIGRHVIAATVRSFGYNVREATDGVAAWNTIQAEDISLVITDWQMPGLNGPALVQRIRSVDLDRYVYCIILTVRDGLTDRVRGLDAGADDYLVKPVNPDELRARITIAARILGLEQQLRAANNKLRILATNFHHQATHDSLTGLLNRQGLYEHGTLEIARAERMHYPLGLAMLDLDYFKKINDRYGHAIGDQALIHASNQIRAIVRPYDVVGRWGGEEFLVLMPGVDLNEACVIAERIRMQIANAELSIPDIGVLHLRASLGVTNAKGGEIDFDALIAEADQALYTAKRTGRNRIAGVSHARNPVLDQ
jgi:two-component system chemotaxis response regulator CheY